MGLLSMLALRPVRCMFCWRRYYWFALHAVIGTLDQAFRQSYSLNGTPNVSKAVFGGRCSAPTKRDCLPMALQRCSAVAFM
jgi:hypothetical protein